jgi:mannose-6-phosphate isomerase
MTTFLQFQPLYQERVWGGRALENFPGRKLPGAAPIGESWEMADRPEAQSVVAAGPWAGRTLRAVLAAHAAEIMGPAWPAARPFPILVKWLDCRDRLSVQVHPPADLAGKLHGEPKTENWYFARTDPDAAVYAGLKAGVTRAAFAQALAAGTVARCLERTAVRAGDSLLIPSGTMHAIDAGSLILEIQQNSDTTFRAYDWDRPGLDGKPRALHVAQSLECIGADPGPAPRPVRGPGVLASCREFTIRQQVLRAGEILAFAGGEQARILSVVAGELEDGRRLAAGDNALLPFGAGISLVARTEATVLVTEDFSRR